MYGDNKVKDFIHVSLMTLGITLIWLGHVLFSGWFNYLFRPTTYLIRVGDIIADMERKGKGSHWWNRYDCEAAREVVMRNDLNAIAKFTWRVHPWYLSNRYLYVDTPHWKARIWNNRRKIYHSI